MPLTWDDSLQPVDGERIATVALSRTGWEALGARFFDVEDPIGGVSRLAPGVAKLAPDASVPFGVLDHNADMTFLLGPRETDAADLLIDAIVAAGVPAVAIVERLPASAPPSVEERLSAIESAQRNLAAALLASRSAVRDVLAHRPSPANLALAYLMLHEAELAATTEREDERLPWLEEASQDAPFATYDEAELRFARTWEAPPSPLIRAVDWDQLRALASRAGVSEGMISTGSRARRVTTYGDMKITLVDVDDLAKSSRSRLEPESNARRPRARRTATRRNK
jgi:hypothetical protein